MCYEYSYNGEQDFTSKVRGYKESKFPGFYIMAMLIKKSEAIKL